MTRSALQLNYLPNELLPNLAPTDSRLRPDQRALENGDFALATSEKLRLEEKQRAARKKMEAEKTHHKPKYFYECIHKPNIPECKGQEHKEYRYNSLYFEKDRLEKNWTRLPDLYGKDDDFKSE